MSEVLVGRERFLAAIFSFAVTYRNSAAVGFVEPTKKLPISLATSVLLYFVSNFHILLSSSWPYFPSVFSTNKFV